MKYSAMLTMIALGCVFAAGPGAWAQNETVTVTGAKPKEDTVIRDFVRSFAPPSRALKKITRWADPVCPYTAGLQPDVNTKVTARVKQVAAQIGAPTKEGACNINIQIIFALDPQAVLDEARHHFKQLIGDVYGPSDAEEKTRVTHPIQAWYGTEIKDDWGQRVPSEPCWPKLCYVVSKGGNINDGLQSVFSNVLVVIDLNKVDGYDLNAVSDYVAMLALSQSKSFDDCRQLPTITNLMSAGCDDELKAKALTAEDIAYLHGLYMSAAGDKMNLQQGDIEGEIAKAKSAK